MRDKEKYVSGYMTVEASLIMAMVMLVYLFIIRCVLFQYDRCVMEEDMARIAVKYTDINKDTLDETNRLVKLRWDEQQFLLLSPTAPELEMKGGYVILTSQDDKTKLSHARKYKIWHMNPEDLLRIQRKILTEQKKEEGNR